MDYLTELEYQVEALQHRIYCLNNEIADKTAKLEQINEATARAYNKLEQIVDRMIGLQ